MRIEKLFGSKAKTDILKYLIFRRQGVSMRALESETGRTFPAIKKQVDSLEQTGVVSIDKDQKKRSIELNPEVQKVLKNLFLFGLKSEIDHVLQEHEFIVKEYYLGEVFGFEIQTDIIVVYQNCEKELLDVLKKQLSTIFQHYRIESAFITLLSGNDRDKRYQLADRFVLSVLRAHG